MAELIKVGMANYGVVRPPDKLACFGIGSCICIALYEPSMKIAGLAHAMLPETDTEQLEKIRASKYANTAVQWLIAKMTDCGADKDKIMARLVGGATMFSFPGKSGTQGLTLGERNLLSARKSLFQQGIRITGEETGGSIGRSLEFDAQDGSLQVRSAWKAVRWL